MVPQKVTIELGQTQGWGIPTHPNFTFYGGGVGMKNIYNLDIEKTLKIETQNTFERHSRRLSRVSPDISISH